MILLQCEMRCIKWFAICTAHGVWICRIFLITDAITIPTNNISINIKWKPFYRCKIAAREIVYAGKVILWWKALCAAFIPLIITGQILKIASLFKVDIESWNIFLTILSITSCQWCNFNWSITILWTGFQVDPHMIGSNTYAFYWYIRGRVFLHIQRTYGQIESLRY